MHDGSKDFYCYIYPLTYLKVMDVLCLALLISVHNFLRKFSLFSASCPSELMDTLYWQKNLTHYMAFMEKILKDYHISVIWVVL